MLLTDFPHQILWIILEHVISNFIGRYHKIHQSQYLCYPMKHSPMYFPHFAHASWTWGWFVKEYKYVYDTLYLVDDSLHGKTQNETTRWLGDLHPITFVSMLRSVNTSFRNCIDRNSHFKNQERDVHTSAYWIKPLQFTKRNYTIKT